MMYKSAQVVSSWATTIAYPRSLTDDPRRTQTMNSIYKQFLTGPHVGASVLEDEKSPFDNRSSERLSRDEVLMRPATDPNAVLIKAIIQLESESREVHAAA